MNNTTEKGWYLPQLDILRWWAFFAVFVCHVVTVGIPGPLHALSVAVNEAGAFGVDMFFTLSSYLITTLLVKEMDSTGTINIRSFYKRRVLRIWPLYYGFLFLYYACRLLFEGKFPDSISTVLSFMFLGGNWDMYFGIWPDVIFPLWSVSVEEQFYLCWAPVVKQIRVKWLPWFACALWVTSIITRAAFDWSPSASHYTLGFNTFARLDPIAIGILIATVGSTRFVVVRRKAAITLAVAMLFASRFFWSIITLHNPVLAYLVPDICCGIILLTAVSMPAIGNGSASRALQYLGRISYGLYIFHIFALKIGHWVIPGHSIIRGAVHIALSLGITIGLAALSYRFYESWFLRRKNQPLFGTKSPTVMERANAVSL